MTIVLSSLGGIVTFVTAVFFLIRSVVRAVGAVNENTQALKKMDETMVHLNGIVSQNSIDIAVLQDRIRRR